jgi:multimeric flavodoxin WrbA
VTLERIHIDFPNLEDDCFWAYILEYRNIGIGQEIGKVSEDEEGMKTMAVLDKNMAWLMKKLFA